MMENKNNENKKKLAEELKERLRWYQEEAAPEEMDAEEITGILRLLDKLDPLPEDGVTAKEAYRRFEQEYLDEADKGSAGKSKTTGKRARRTRITVLRRIAIAAAAVVLLFALLDIGTYATAKKGFFEFLSDGVNGPSFFVTGEGAEDMDGNYNEPGNTVYTNWNEVPDEVKNRICVPAYVPEGLEIEEIACSGHEINILVKLLYKNNVNNNFLEVVAERYEDVQFWRLKIDPDAELLEEDKIENREVYFYQYEGNIIAYFFEKDMVYEISGTYSIEEIGEVIRSMK